MICTTLIECQIKLWREKQTTSKKRNCLKNRYHNKKRTQNLQLKRNQTVKLFNFRKHIRKIWNLPRLQVPLLSKPQPCPFIIPPSHLDKSQDISKTNKQGCVSAYCSYKIVLIKKNDIQILELSLNNAKFFRSKFRRLVNTLMWIMIGFELLLT